MKRMLFIAFMLSLVEPSSLYSMPIDKSGVNEKTSQDELSKTLKKAIISDDTDLAKKVLEHPNFLKNPFITDMNLLDDALRYNRVDIAKMIMDHQKIKFIQLTVSRGLSNRPGFAMENMNDLLSYAAKRDFKEAVKTLLKNPEITRNGVNEALLSLSGDSRYSDKSIAEVLLADPRITAKTVNEALLKLSGDSRYSDKSIAEVFLADPRIRAKTVNEALELNIRSDRNIDIVNLLLADPRITVEHVKELLPLVSGQEDYTSGKKIEKELLEFVEKTEAVPTKEARRKDAATKEATAKQAAAREAAERIEVKEARRKEAAERIAAKEARRKDAVRRAVTKEIAAKKEAIRRNAAEEEYLPDISSPESAGKALVGAAAGGRERIVDHILSEAYLERDDLKQARLKARENRHDKIAEKISKYEL